MSEPPIEPGQRYVWEPGKPHAEAVVTVAAVNTNEDGETWIETVDTHGRKAWNELERFLEATVPLVPAAELAALRRDAERATELLAACETLIRAAREAYNAWDEDRDVRVGKLLNCMTGGLVGYRVDIEAALAAVDAARGTP